MTATDSDLPHSAPICSILIVDDNSSMRQVLRMVLSDWNCVTKEACNAEQAIVAVKNERFDLAIIDIGMAGMSGLELCHILKRDHSANIPLRFILSGFWGSHALDEARAAGVTVFLQKPLGMQELREAMENHGLLGRPSSS